MCKQTLLWSGERAPVRLTTTGGASGAAFLLDPRTAGQNKSWGNVSYQLRDTNSASPSEGAPPLPSELHNPPGQRETGQALTPRVSSPHQCEPTLL